MHIKNNTLSLPKITPQSEEYTKIYGTVRRLKFCDVQLDNLGRAREAMGNISSDDPSTDKHRLLNFSDNQEQKIFEFFSEESGQQRSSIDPLEQYSSMHETWLVEKEALLSFYSDEFNTVDDYLFSNNVFLQIIFFYSDKLYATAHPELERFAKCGIRILTICLILEVLALLGTLIIALSNYLISSNIKKPVQIDFLFLIYFSLANLIFSYFTNVTCLLRMRTHIYNPAEKQKKEHSKLLRETSSY